MKTYFVKVSWTDPDQPLRRIHMNSKVSVDITSDEWKLVNEVEDQVRGKFAERVEDFTVDFMMVLESEE